MDSWVRESIFNGIVMGLGQGGCYQQGKIVSLDQIICAYFEKDLWFELVKSMWCNHSSTFQDHVKYIHNDIVKPFRFLTLQYAECIHDMNDIPKYLPAPSMKHGHYDEAYWAVHYK